MKRNIIRIDEDKCTGCGICVTACAEGALKIVDGKAKLVSEIYCDGLGACLPECPEGALAIEERESEEFDEESVKKHLKTLESIPQPHHSHPHLQICPSAQVMHLERPSKAREAVSAQKRNPSMLSHWPVQLRLLPPTTSFFKDADLLVAADCVPFTSANFHQDFLQGRAVVIGCPKLDDAQFYKNRLTEIFKKNNINSITVVNMEVPCCFGLHNLVKEAISASGKNIPLRQEIITIKGDTKASPSQDGR
ncbi:MAG: 4Fe-4S binding protein [Candidatus Bathyarchaeota archaeon]|nr:MAG: 4Fe-4S binding protein [Candidatus Bathyarchaeota archaeon]